MRVVIGQSTVGRSMEIGANIEKKGAQRTHHNRLMQPFWAIKNSVLPSDRQYCKYIEWTECYIHSHIDTGRTLDLHTHDRLSIALCYFFFSVPLSLDAAQFLLVNCVRNVIGFGLCHTKGQCSSSSSSNISQGKAQISLMKMMWISNLRSARV